MGSITSTSATSDTNHNSSSEDSTPPQQDAKLPDIEQTDLSIFESNQSPPNNCTDHRKCPSLLRLSLTLKYYSKLDIINNQHHRHTLIQHISKIHTNLIEDYVHFIKDHGDQIEDIHNDFIQNRGFTACEINECTFASRHHGLDGSNTAKFHTTLEFYKQTLDSVHFYIFHIFDAGLRSISTNTQTAESEATSGAKDDPYFDVEFARIKSSLLRTNFNTDLFPRFRRGNNSKFNIDTKYHVMDNEDDDYIYNGEDHNNKEIEETFMDSMYGHLKSMKINDKIIGNLKKFLEKEQYETDTLSTDIIDIGHIGNVLQSINDQNCAEIIQNFFKTITSLSYFGIFFECVDCNHNAYLK